MDDTVFIGGPEKRAIVIEEYDPAWAARFEQVKASLAEALGPRALRIEHFGSTAVPGLGAKGIIDVLVGRRGRRRRGRLRPRARVATASPSACASRGTACTGTPDQDVHAHVFTDGSEARAHPPAVPRLAAPRRGGPPALRGHQAGAGAPGVGGDERLLRRQGRRGGGDPHARAALGGVAGLTAPAFAEARSGRAGRPDPNPRRTDMKAVAWHGKRDVRVDTVPDPIIEEPTDAIVRITSTGICGSDLHLYEVLGPFMGEGDILGHEPMGIVEEVGAEVTNLATGDRVVIPFNISCGHCFMCDQGLQSQCETTQVRDQGMGAALFGYTKLYGQVPGRPGRVPARAAGPVRADQGARGPAGRSLRLPLRRAAHRLAGRRVRRHPRRRLGRGARPRPDRRHVRRIAQHRGAGKVIGIDLVPERLERARAHGDRGARPLGQRRHRRHAARPDRRPRARLGHRRRRHGGPRRAVRQGGAADRRAHARRDRGEDDGEGRRRPPRASSTRRSTSSAAAARSRYRRLRRHDRPAADAHACSTSRSSCAWARPTSSAGSTTSCRCSSDERPARRRRLRHAPPAARRRRPEAYEMFQKKQDGAVKILLQP